MRSLFSFIRNQETSVLWVTHELEEALKFSDRLGLLNFGKFEQIAAPASLVESPKNLFVAQFLGFENFFPVTRNSEGWETPWGILEREQGPNFDEAFLVIPSDAWEIGQNGISAIVKDQYLKGPQKMLRMTLENREVQVTIPRSYLNPHLGSQLNLHAKLDDCFLIPL